jgi:hypothetical protein
MTIQSAIYLSGNKKKLYEDIRDQFDGSAASILNQPHDFIKAPQAS